MSDEPVRPVDRDEGCRCGTVRVRHLLPLGEAVAQLARQYGWRPDAVNVSLGVYCARCDLRIDANVQLGMEQRIYIPGQRQPPPPPSRN